MHFYSSRLKQRACGERTMAQRAPGTGMGPLSRVVMVTALVAPTMGFVTVRGHPPSLPGAAAQAVREGQRVLRGIVFLSEI